MTAATSTSTCGYCLWSIEIGQDVEQCDKCHRSLHTECWIENQGCPELPCAPVDELYGLFDPDRQPDPTSPPPYVPPGSWA